MSTLCSFVYAKHFYMKVYLIVRFKSMVSLLLEVTEYPDLEVEYDCLYLRKNLIYKINNVDISECSISDPCLNKTETYIHVDPITIQAKCINPPMTSFEKFDFNRSVWISLSQSLKFTNWIHELDQVSSDEFLPVVMNILISKCSIHVPLKRPKEARKSQF